VGEHPASRRGKPEVHEAALARAEALLARGRAETGVPRNVISVFGGLYRLPGIGNTLTVAAAMACADSDRHTAATASSAASSRTVFSQLAELSSKERVSEHTWLRRVALLPD
jgi:hypothetical protein